MKLFWQSLTLIASFLAIFVCVNSPLSQYTVPILGLLIVSYLLVSSRKGGKGFFSMGGEGPWGIFALNTLVFLLIFSTEGIKSPLFFLLYFLSFGIAFVFEPITVFVFILGSLFILFPQALALDTTNNLLKLGSLLLISPLAFFFGREYKKSYKDDEAIEGLKERTKDAADTISKDVEDVLKKEKENLKPEDVEKLNDALEQTADLREESKI
jgi:hypothetical protein